jgi:hypothetical protein
MRTACLLVLVSLGLPAVAEEESGGLRKSLEMPGHRSLQSVIADPESTLAPFETDGCSGGMSWSWRIVADVFPGFEAAQGAHPPWESCCVVHDRAYHDAGGTREAEASFAARLAADEALRACVVSNGEQKLDELAAHYDVSPEQVRFAYSLISDAMFQSVRFGGGPCSGLPWRWGFGYPGCVPGL